jgi:hypothetical protein
MSIRTTSLPKIQIPNVFSSPTDPAKLSFLTTFPPEIRNVIYEFLYKRNDPVLLTKFLLHNDDDSSVEFRHGFGAALLFLLSCRQVYHEAIGIFYGNNTWMFTRPVNTIEPETGALLSNSLFLDQDEPEQQKNHAPQWLLGIGSNTNYVRNVLVDCDAFYYEQTPMNQSSIDLLPLMRVIWKNSGSALSISFVRSGRRIAPAR